MRNNNIEERDRRKQQKKMIATKDMVLVGLLASVLCVLGPFSFVFPMSPVPISFASLAIYLGVYAVGRKRGCISCMVYLFIGFIGIPVFSGFTGGAGKLFGPTGGYLLGYIFMAMLSGFFIEKWREKKYLHLVGMVFGTIVCYGIGTLWLAFEVNMNFYEALWAGVLPFIPGDTVKIMIALTVGSSLYEGLQKAKLV